MCGCIYFRNVPDIRNWINHKNKELKVPILQTNHDIDNRMTYDRDPTCQHERMVNHRGIKKYQQCLWIVLIMFNMRFFTYMQSNTISFRHDQKRLVDILSRFMCMVWVNKVYFINTQIVWIFLNMWRSVVDMRFVCLLYEKSCPIFRFVNISWRRRAAY